jgi:hypothetical protein
MINKRPVMQDYSEQNSNIKKPSSNPQGNNDPFNHQNSNQNTNKKVQQNNNVQNRVVENTSNSHVNSQQNQSQIQNKIVENRVENTIQRAKPVVKKDYKIEPKVIPRPSFVKEIYRSEDKTCIYNTNEGSSSPLSTSYYIVNETENSSCRYLRPTFNKLPCEQKVLDGTNLVMGK